MVRDLRDDTVNGHLHIHTVCGKGTNPLDKIEKTLKFQETLKYMGSKLIKSEDGKTYSVNQTFNEQGHILAWVPGIYEETSIEALRQRFDRPDELMEFDSIAGKVLVHKDDVEYIRFREEELKNVAKEMGFSGPLDPRLAQDYTVIERIRTETLRRASAKFGPCKRRVTSKSEN